MGNSKSKPTAAPVPATAVAIAEAAGLAAARATGTVLGAATGYASAPANSAASWKKLVESAQRMLDLLPALEGQERGYMDKMVGGVPKRINFTPEQAAAASNSLDVVLPNLKASLAKFRNTHPGATAPPAFAATFAALTDYLAARARNPPAKPSAESFARTEIARVEASAAAM